MSKKIIVSKIDLVCLDIDMEAISLEELSLHIPELIITYGKDAYIDKEYYGYDGAYDLFLHFERYETDAEEKKRLDAEEKERLKKVKKEHRERLEYERLKKKFGDA